MTTITLQDLDNRDDEWTRYQFTGTAEKVIGYIDGPVRRDLTEVAVSTGLLDSAIEHLRAERFVAAASLLDGFAIRLFIDGTLLERTCSTCGCTERDCSQCIARTGQPCGWAGPDLCTACIS